MESGGRYLPFFHKFSPPMWDEYPHMSNTFGEVKFIENNPWFLAEAKQWEE